MKMRFYLPNHIIQFVFSYQAASYQYNIYPLRIGLDAVYPLSIKLVGVAENSQLFFCKAKHKAKKRKKRGRLLLQIDFTLRQISQREKKIEINEYPVILKKPHAFYYETECKKTLYFAA
jgi:hypothetical protein